MQNRMLDAMRGGALAMWVALLASCGGGGGGGATQLPSGGAADPSASAASLANVCTVEGEKAFTRAYLNEAYLWYSEIPSVDASAYSNVTDYFYALLTRQRDASGQFKDRFSFITTNANADTISSGASVGYGVNWESDAQGRVRVAYVEPGSPAAQAGLRRGGVLVNTLTPNASWYPNASSSISFVYQSTPGAVTTTVSLSTAPVQEDAVPLDTTFTSAVSGRRIGYMVFHAHITGAQDQLIQGVRNASGAGVQDLVLDMRYNRGGFLYTAQTLGSMIVGPAQDGQVFERLQFSDKRASDTRTYPVVSTVQHGESQFATGTALPRLALPRVYVLATGQTCSASESVINGLRGVGIDVVLIGQTTCGKPYGFARHDNCGWSYYPIEFQGVNAAGFGDYTHGFAPTCAATDDFEHALGDRSERLLATALYHVDHGSCPMPPLAAPLASTPAPDVPRPPWRGKLLP